MSNVLTGNPLILDTVADNLLTGPIHITKIRWVGATTVDHEAQLEDAAERVVWESLQTDIGTGTAILNRERESTFVPPLLVTGLSLGVLGSGVLYVYYADPTPLA